MITRVRWLIRASNDVRDVARRAEGLSFTHIFLGSFSSISDDEIVYFYDMLHVM